MPNYDWLLTQNLDTATTAAKIKAMRTLGVPYPEGYEKIANNDLSKQEKEIADNLYNDHIKVKNNKEIVALIDYLQRLGTDIKASKTAAK
jgi:cytochrome c oxidase cbb3-type subunit I/II